MQQAVLTIILLLASITYTQAADITAISNAFKTGKAASLTASMDQEVDVAVPGTSKKGKPEEATKILNNFFTQNKPSGFTVAHHADKKETGFFVGKLSTPDNEFRVNVTYRVDGEKVLIQSIRIE